MGNLVAALDGPEVKRGSYLGGQFNLRLGAAALWLCRFAAFLGKFQMQVSFSGDSLRE